MTTRIGVPLALACAAMLALPQAAAAQQTINFSLGYFTLRSHDARVDGDVLVANRDIFDFDPDGFNGPIFGAEWLFPIGQYIEGGAGFSFSRRTVESVYLDYTECLVETVPCPAESQIEIEQDFRLRVIPMAFTFRALPLGQQSPVQPYAGAGIGIFNWRYVEEGDFIDFGQAHLPIDPDRFVGSGTTVGPIVLFGVRYAAQVFTVGGEVRYQRATGDLPEAEFYGTKIDLGGWTYLVTAGVRFGL